VRDLVPGLNDVRPVGRSPSVPPEVFEPRRAQGRVTRGVGDGDMAEPVRVRVRSSADGLTHPVLAIVFPA
jgi:hypothetical protein